MLYLLDANVLIDANRDYYPLARVPQFWEWLIHVGRRGLVKVPQEVYEEIKDGNDDLAAWIKQPEVKDALVLEADADPGSVSRVVVEGYAADLTDDEVEKIGRDPFLISYALMDPAAHCIVTTEVSKPRRGRANRHIPDVCDDIGVRSCDTFTFIRELDFRTDWDAR